MFLDNDTDELPVVTTMNENEPDCDDLDAWVLRMMEAEEDGKHTLGAETW